MVSLEVRGVFMKSSLTSNRGRQHSWVPFIRELIDQIKCQILEQNDSTKPNLLMKARERRQKSPFLSNWVLDRIKKHKKKETNRSHYLAQMHGLHDMRSSSYLDTIKGRGWAKNTSLPRRPLRIEVRRRTIWEWGPRRRRGASIGLSHPSWSFSADSPPPGARSGFIPGYGESPMAII